MVPMHIITAARKALSYKTMGLSDALLSTSAEKKGHASPPKRPISATEATVARIIVATTLSLVLSGAIITLNWGGVGLGYEAPELSVRPGINAEWKSSNIAPLIAQLESDSREIYRERGRIAALVGFREGADIADVGAGSGFMAEEFARRVGPGGRVTAIEINPAFVSYIENRAQRAGLANLRSHLGLEDKMNLSRREGGNFDYVFLVDTYHHLEYPKSMLASFHRLLRRRGELIIVEPHRIPGQSSEAVLEHVRLGKTELIREITEAGFLLAAEPAAPFLTENYVLRFKR